MIRSLKTSTRILGFSIVGLGLCSLVVSGCLKKSSLTLAEVVSLGNTPLASDNSASVYDSQLLQIDSQGRISLKPQYSALYTFSDLSDQGWSSQVTATGGTFSTGPDFSAGLLSFASLTDWVGLALASSTQSDYVQLVEYQASVFDGASTLSTCMRMQGNLDDHYRFSLASGNLDISYRATSAFTSAGTQALALTPAADTTYMVKSTAVGSTLGLRIWQKGTAEPSSDQLSVTDATYASGSPCLLFQAGQTATVDNIRIGGSTYTSDYSTANPTFVFPEFDQRSGVVAVQGEASEPGDDRIRFDVSTDGGTTYQTWNGSQWNANTAGYSGAVSLATLSAFIQGLPRGDLGRVKIRAYFHSELGYTSPSLTPLTIVHTQSSN